MSHIKSRKHPAGRMRPQTTLATTALAAGLALSMPAGAQTPPPKPSTLPEVNVKAQAASEDYKADTLSSPKFTAPLIDTPRTVTVIREGLIREQGATTLTEALRNSPGVGAFYLGENGNTSTGDGIYMRGFDASGSIFVDGIRDLGSVSRDTFNIESIEVIKGASGADYGRTAPGGSINLVTKQPMLENAVAGSLGLGTHDQKRATADLNRVLGETSAFRLNLLKQDSGVPGRNQINNNRFGVAPSLAWGLGTETRVFLNYLYMKQKGVLDGGVPTIGLPGYEAPNLPGTPSGTRNPDPFLGSGAKVNPRGFYGTNSDYNDVEANMFTARFEHDLGENTTLRNVTRWGKTTQDYQLTAFQMPASNNSANPNDWTLARNLATFKDQENEIISNQTNLTTKLNTGSLEHTLSTGLEFSREKQRSLGRSGTMPATNLYHPDPNALVTSSYNGTHANGQTDTSAFYAFDTIKLTPEWLVNGGLRYEHYKTTFDSTVVCGGRNAPVCGSLPTGSVVPGVDESTSGNLFNWTLGTVYKVAPNGSIYANYAVAQQPPGGANFELSTANNSANNAKFAPQKAKTAEIGTKWDVLNKKLGLAAALYRTDITNEVITDIGGAVGQNGKKRVQGIELTAVGQITSAWAVSTGFTTMDSSVENGPNVGADAGSSGLNYTPKNAFTLWSTYRLPFGLTVGGGMRYNGKLQRGSDGAVGTPAYTDSYTVFDAVATYTVNKNLDLQLNLYNIFDKDYVANINKSGYRYTPGIARSAMLTANFRF